MILRSAAALLAALGLHAASTEDGKVGAPPPCPLGAGWVFEAGFSDEFDGTQLDADKWWDFNPAWHGRKPAYFDRGNVRVSEGSLRLMARELDPSEVSVENKVRGHDRYSTAIVKSKRRVGYGYFEARCRSMSANVCNAFWLCDPLDAPAKYREGDFSEEIDIFEVFGKPKNAAERRVFFATVHCYHTPYVESLVNTKKVKLPDYSAKVKMPFDFDADYHLYALLWTPETLEWFVDGKKAYARTNDCFKRPLHMVFDAEVMQSWVGLPESADLPATFSVDYVRVWRRAE